MNVGQDLVFVSFGLGLVMFPPSSWAAPTWAADQLCLHPALQARQLMRTEAERVTPLSRHLWWSGLYCRAGAGVVNLLK